MDEPFQLYACKYLLMTVITQKTNQYVQMRLHQTMHLPRHEAVPGRPLRQSPLQLWQQRYHPDQFVDPFPEEQWRNLFPYDAEDDVNDGDDDDLGMVLPTMAGSARRKGSRSGLRMSECISKEVLLRSLLTSTSRSLPQKIITWNSEPL